LNFDEYDKLKEHLDSVRPLPKAVVKNLREDQILRWIYHSNAIEGNTLTLKETKVVLEGITVGGKSLREHLEVINHRDAIYYVEAIVQERQDISAHIIRSIHQLVLKGIDDANAGKWRDVNVIIAGARHTPPDFIHIAKETDLFIEWYEQVGRTLHPVERAARVHVDFVKIHPFTDGNGRVSRLLMNLELIKNGFPPVVVSAEQRLAYYQALDAAHVENNYRPFLQLVASLVRESFNPYWRALGLDS